MTFPKIDGQESYDVTPFMVAQKFFLPIVPVSIKNLDGNFFHLNPAKVKVVFHKPIKPMQIIHFDADRVSKMVKEINEK